MIVERVSRPFKIISGGQTGADRAALDWAIAAEVKHGGWCPKGRKAEDGAIPAGYSLQETPTEDYAQRTEWNVRDSDGTVIFSIADELRGGTLLTQQLAMRLKRPCCHITRRRSVREASEMLTKFIQEHGIQTLNIAGPRQSEEPQVGDFVRHVLGGWYATA